MQIKRDDIIKYGVEHKASADKIDQVLKKYGYAPYNPLIEKESWAHAGKRILPSLREVGRDAITFGGEVIKPIGDIINRNKTVSEIVNDPTIKKALAGAAIGGGIGSKVGPIGILGGALLGGAIGGLGPEGFANANLSVYNTNIRDLLSGKTNWKDVVQGAQHNPTYATIDILSAGGAKALGNKMKGIGDTLPKDAPLWARQIFPSKDVRDLNRRLSDSIGTAKAKTGKNYEAYGILETDRNIPREELVNHIRTGKSNLKDKQKLLADALVKSLRANEKEAVNLGLISKEDSANNVIAQYMMQRLDPKLNILFEDVADYAKIGDALKDTSRIAKLINENPDFKNILESYYNEGVGLYNKKNIAFLTEKFAGQKDPLNERIARDINKDVKEYWKTGRITGRATAKDLAPVLDESIKFQLDQISHSKEFYDIMDDILTNTKVGRDIPIEKLPDIRAKAMASIAKDIGKGELPDFNKALREAGLKDYIDPVYFNTLNNVFRKPLNTGLRRVLSAFKKNVLATPHWTFLNRMGNWPNNFIEGVTLKDYFDTRKYSKYLPDQLKNQTSFSSYLNEGLEQLSDPGSLQYSGISSSINVPLNKLKRAKGKFEASNKSLDDIWDYVSSLYANTNDLVANPIFKAESIMELTDRYANYIRQAKRVSKKLNVPVEKVLEEAKNDPRLYNKLNTEVNKSLGDYTGKMYNLPSKFYNVLSEAIPFYRFYAQTLRTTAHQLANNPLGYQSIIQSPTKIGREKAEEIKNAFGFSDDWYQGGIPYGQTADGNIRTIGYEPVPIANVLQTIGNVGQGEDVIQLMNPIISSLTPALMFQKFGKTATTPRLDEYKRSNSYEVSNFKPTIGEYARYMTSSMLGATSAWYNMIQRWGREIGADITKKGLQSRYDTHPFTEIPSSYRRTLPTELTGKQFGIKTYSNYKQKPRSKSRVKRDRRSEMFFKKKEMDAKLPLEQL